MASTIDVYDALVTTVGGVNKPTDTPAAPKVTITGSGVSDADSSPVSTGADGTVRVIAGGYATIYDRATHGRFDLFRIVPSGDVDVWYQVGSPEDDSTAKANLVWGCLSVIAANGPFKFVGDKARTNTVAATHAADSGDLPAGLTDSGALTGRIQKIIVSNRGSSAVSVEWQRRN